MTNKICKVLKRIKDNFLHKISWWQIHEWQLNIVDVSSFGSYESLVMNRISALNQIPYHRLLSCFKAISYCTSYVSVFCGIKHPPVTAWRSCRIWKMFNPCTLPVWWFHLFCYYDHLCLLQNEEFFFYIYCEESSRIEIFARIILSYPKNEELNRQQMVWKPHRVE